MGIFGVLFRVGEFDYCEFLPFQPFYLVFDGGGRGEGGSNNE